MLVLTRKVGESVVINGTITVTVLEVQPGPGGRVRLGITAGKDVPIWRGELVVDVPLPSNAKEVRE